MRFSASAATGDFVGDLDVLNLPAHMRPVKPLPEPVHWRDPEGDSAAVCEAVLGRGVVVGLVSLVFV
jgi:hypothetical protein